MAKIDKADMSCARVKQYTASDVSKAERHNERKNETYENMNVIVERIPLMCISKADCPDLYGAVKADGNRRAGVASWVKERRYPFQ